MLPSNNGESCVWPSVCRNGSTIGPAIAGWHVSIDAVYRYLASCESSSECDNVRHRTRFSSLNAPCTMKRAPSYESRPRNEVRFMKRMKFSKKSHQRLQRTIK